MKAARASQENALHNEFKQGAFLAEGSYGAVYDGKHRETGTPVAMKFEAATSRKAYLTREANVYDALHHEVGIPHLYWYGTTSKYRVLVLEKLCCSLDAYVDYSDHYIPLPILLAMARQTLTRLRTVHDAGYVHRDVKPDNFMLGPCEDGKATQAFLIDFGLTVKYLRATGSRDVLIPMTKGHSMVGTPRFASIRVHNGVRYARRDDLESWCYMLAYLLRGNLPWQQLKPGRGQPRKIRYALIGACKATVSPTQLFYGFAPEFSQLLTYVRDLSYKETPNYEWMMSRLSSIGERTLLDIPMPTVRELGNMEKKYVDECREMTL
jgi:serine/threonine protein kinase